MPPPATLSRAEFNQACQELTQKYPGATQHNDRDAYIKALCGWTWFEHKTVPGWGHLSRTAVSKFVDSTDSAALEGSEEEVFEPEDESNVSETTPETNRLYLHECVVWHPTYMVPTYYFQAYDSGGSPSNLTQILTTDRFQHRAFRNAGIEVSGVAVQPLANDNAQFPLLSQGDHPILGTPHWYFHPCETSAAVTEILEQMPDVQWSQSSPDHPLRWLEAWFTVLSTAIDLT